jgi:hypothetical protein
MNALGCAMITEVSCAFDLYMDSSSYWREKLVEKCEEINDHRQREINKAKSKRK